jgi:predicted nucleic acid-binding protein
VVTGCSAPATVDEVCGVVAAISTERAVAEFLSIDHLQRPSCAEYADLPVFHRDPPVAVMEAVAVARVYLDASNVQCVPTDAAAARLTLELVERHRLGRKRLADTLFAATLLRNDVNTLLTFNHGDFGLFEGLSTIDPRAELD